MWALKAFVLGTLALAVVGYAAAAALAVAAQASGATLDVGIGPLGLVSVTLAGTTRVTTFGPGILVVALAGGAANVVAAQLIRRGANGRSDAVD